MSRLNVSGEGKDESNFDTQQSLVDGTRRTVKPYAWKTGLVIC